jgi:hypothetical protein
MKLISNNFGYVTNKLRIGMSVAVPAAVIAVSFVSNTNLAKKQAAAAFGNSASSMTFAERGMLNNSDFERLASVSAGGARQDGQISPSMIRPGSSGREFGYGEKKTAASSFEEQEISEEEIGKGILNKLGADAAKRGVDSEVSIAGNAAANARNAVERANAANAAAGTGASKGGLRTSAAQSGGSGGDGSSSGVSYSLPTASGNLVSSSKVDIDQLQSMQERSRGPQFARTGGRSGSTGGSNVGGTGAAVGGAGQRGAGYGAGSDLATARKYSRKAAASIDSSKSAAEAGYAFDGGVGAEESLINPDGTVRTSEAGAPSMDMPLQKGSRTPFDAKAAKKTELENKMNGLINTMFTVAAIAVAALGILSMFNALPWVWAAKLGVVIAAGAALIGLLTAVFIAAGKLKGLGFGDAASDYNIRTPIIFALLSGSVLFAYFAGGTKKGTGVEKGTPIKKIIEQSAGQGGGFGNGFFAKAGGKLIDWLSDIFRPGGSK